MSKIGTEEMVCIEPVTPNPKASDMTLRDHEDEDMLPRVYVVDNEMLKLKVIYSMDDSEAIW